MRMWRKETLRKDMSLLLCLVMVLGMLPVPSFAAEGEPCALTADCAGFYDAEGICAVCGLVELPEHTHVYNGEAFYSQKDDNVHAVTRACTGCEEKPTETVDETHTYIEGVCVCGKEAPAPDHTHVYDGEAVYAPKDENVHVVTRVCTGCEEKPTQAADENHTYEDGVCACGVLEPAKEPECNCGVKCDKEFQDEECPVCSMGDYADCVGNEISAFLSGNYTDNGTMQYNQGDTTIDVQGAGGVQTTYSNYGYYLKTTNNLSGKVAASATFANGGSYVKLSYTVTNDTGSQITGDVGICADVQIGTDDKATITAIKNAEGSRVIGLKMVDTNETGQLQFNLYFRNAAGVTDADRYWIGAYSGGDYKNHWNDASTAESFSGQDSALAVSWDVSLAPGESKTYSVIVGVGEVADPPQFEDNGVALTMSAEATPDNLLIHVNAKVKDASGVTDSLYYNENGGAEQQLGNPVIGDGESEKEITGVIDLTKKPDGTYKYQFWIVNSKGATSEVVERTITITNGKVTGDVTKVTNKYNVRVVTPSNGSLSANGSIVESGTEITVTFAPAEGYELDELTITDKNGYPVEVTATGNTRTFTMPASNVTVTATFKQSTVPVTGITVNPSSLTMSVGDTVSLVTDITPSNATHQELEWSSDNAAVATVDKNGKISAVGSGEATITVKAKDGSNTSATCAVHVHGWNYQVEDGTLDTITAKCGVGSCAENGGTLTIIKPALTVYGGTGSKDAVLNASENSVFDAANLSIRYRVKDGAEQNAAPTDAGTYVASVTAGNATARVEYTIAKASNFVTAPTAKTLTYNGQAQELVDAAVCGHGTVFYSLDGTNYSTAIPKGTNAGSYTVFYKVAGDENHLDVEPRSVLVTVSRKSLAGAEATLSDTVIFNGQSIPELTVKDENITLEKNRDYTVTQTSTNGEFTMTITGIGNYKDDAAVKPAYLVVNLPDNPAPDDKVAIDTYDRFAKLNERYQDAELKEALEKVYEDLTDYDIIKGHKSNYVKGSYKELTITANGYYDEFGSYIDSAYGKFLRVEVDGEVLDPQYYSAKSGSTVITLKTVYLESLKTGKHYINVIYTDGNTGNDEYFRISVNNGSPITGDGSHIQLLSAVALTSLLCMAMMIVFFPRKKGKYQR